MCGQFFNIINVTIIYEKQMLNYIILVY